MAIGQCWMSQAEPELGLGFISELQARTISILFPASGKMRTYGMSMAPIQRVQFKVGDRISTQSGERLHVEHIEVVDGLTIYMGEGKTIPESQLATELSFSRPEDRLLNGTVDPWSLYQLRQKALLLQHSILGSKAVGFMGPRAALLPHQLYVASEVTKRAFPRVLLADEVGLGKTIEAGFILHRLLLTGKASRVLIVVPHSLTHQWFVEMYRRFNLSFGVLSTPSDFENDQNPFEEKQTHIMSLDLLSNFEPARQSALSSPWDLLIVDEAHRLKWTPEKVSPEFELIENLAARVPGLLLLTATPEQLGPEGHFARLHLLDANRFHSYEEFQREAEAYQSVVKLADRILNCSGLEKKDLESLALEIEKILQTRIANSLESEDGQRQLIQELVDRFGTGRVLFRNSRASAASAELSFPQRSALPYPLDPQDTDDLTTKHAWLVDFLKSKKEKKVLLICHDKETVLTIQEKMRETPSIKVAAFHSDLTLMERDRNATYFADPEGAQVLLCSEIGSEGRNFQFSQDLVLFDLPPDLDLLEQRIGRLDRIGQADNINIHIPFIRSSKEEAWFRWVHEGFNAFQEIPKGARVVAERLETKIDFIRDNYNASSDHQTILDELIEETKVEYQKAKKMVEEGRDRLSEINSFDKEKSAALLKTIHDTERPETLKAFLSSVFDAMGVSEEELTEDTTFIQPSDHMYVEHFPELPSQGLQFTCNRELALKREDVHLMSWDHPMIQGIFDFILGQELGNTAVSTWKKRPLNQPPALEAQFILNFVGPKHHHPHEFFPPTLFRVVLDARGESITPNWPRTKLHHALRAAPKQRIQEIKKVPQSALKALFSRAKELAEVEAKETRLDLEIKMKKAMEDEIQRLKNLREKNDLVREEEIQFFKDRKRALLETSEKAELRLDMLQLILP